MIGFLLQNPAAEYFDRKLPFASAVCLFKSQQLFFCLKPRMIGMAQSVVSNVCVNQQEIFIHLILLFRLYQGIGLFFSMPSAKELSRQLIPQNSLILFAILPVLLLFALKIALILPFRYHLHILLFY